MGRIAEELGVSESALRRWVYLADVDGGNGNPEELKSDDKQELSRLRREVRELRMEREILKNVFSPCCAAPIA